MIQARIKEKMLNGTITEDEIRENAAGIHEIILDRVIIPYVIKNQIVLFHNYKGEPIKRNKEKIDEISKLMASFAKGDDSIESVLSKMLEIGMSMEMLMMITRLLNDSIELYRIHKEIEAIQDEKDSEFLDNITNENSIN